MGSPYEKMEVLRGRRLVKECPEITTAPINHLHDGGEEVLLLNKIFANPSSTLCFIPSIQAVFPGWLLLWHLGVPSAPSASPPQVCAVCLCILPCPRASDASPGDWHQGEFSPRFKGTKNLRLIEVDTIGLTSSICFQY